MLGTHLIRGWSATQRVIARSSGEAEYYGVVRGAAEAMGTQSILRDMGVTLKIRLKEDSSAAKGIAERTGLGKLRHVEVNQLWVQEKVKNKVIELTKVKGVDNLADALTKYVGNEDLGKHMRGTHVKVEWGRHEIMPEVTEEIQELPEGLEMGGEGEQEGDLEQGGLSFLGDGRKARGLKQWIRTTLDTTSGNTNECSGNIDESKDIHESNECSGNIDESKDIHESKAHERHKQFEFIGFEHQSKYIHESKAHERPNSGNIEGQHGHENTDGPTEKIGYSDSSNNPTVKLNLDRYNQMNSDGHNERIDYSEWWNHMLGMSFKLSASKNAQGKSYMGPYQHCSWDSGSEGRALVADFALLSVVIDSRFCAPG